MNLLILLNAILMSSLSNLLTSELGVDFQCRKWWDHKSYTNGRILEKNLSEYAIHTPDGEIWGSYQQPEAKGIIEFSWRLWLAELLKAMICRNVTYYGSY